MTNNWFNTQWRKIIPILLLIIGWLPIEMVMGNAEKDLHPILIKGKLTDEGVECQTLRPFNNEKQLYSLIGDLASFQSGDTVRVVGKDVELSFCMQGTTLEVIHIGWLEEPLSKGEKCGDTRCPAGQFCCNESCGICADSPDTVCPTLVPCDPLPKGGKKCGDNICPSTHFCCNESCGICTLRGGGCIEIACSPPE